MLPASPTLTPLECNPVFPDRPWPSSPIQLPRTPRSKEVNPHPLLNRDPPAEVWRGGAPTPHPCSGLWSRFFTPAQLEWTGESIWSHPWAWAIPLIMFWTEHYPLGAATSCCLTPPLMAHPTSPHLKGGPHTTSGEREISRPPIGLEFAPLTGPLRRLVAIWGHFPWTLPPLKNPEDDPHFDLPPMRDAFLWSPPGNVESLPLFKSVRESPQPTLWHHSVRFEVISPLPGARKRAFLPHFGDPQTTSFLHEQQPSLRGTWILLPMNSALERAIPELFPTTHWHLRLFLPPATPSSLLEHGVADIKCVPASLDERTTFGEREINSPCPQLSFATTIILLRPLNKIWGWSQCPHGHPY